MKPLYTIGHSVHAWEHFAELLRAHQIELLIDARTVPASRRHPQYRKDRLEAALAAAGIGYAFLGKELGARRDEPEAYEKRIACYERIAALPAFARGLEEIKRLAGEKRAALMCAEGDALECHRAVLVCRHLRGAFNGNIFHIGVGGSLEPHAEFELRLLERYAPAGLFGVDPDPALVEEAYRRRGREIAYRRSS